MLITLRLYVLYGSQNKQQLSPYTALTDSFLEPWWRGFTARYALSLYITQIRFVFKGLRQSKNWTVIIIIVVVNKREQFSRKTQETTNVWLTHTSNSKLQVTIADIVTVFSLRFNTTCSNTLISTYTRNLNIINIGEVQMANGSH